MLVSKGRARPTVSSNWDSGQVGPATSDGPGKVRALLNGSQAASASRSLGSIALKGDQADIMSIMPVKSTPPCQCNPG